jgi:hypothetical protein
MQAWIFNTVAHGPRQVGEGGGRLIAFRRSISTSPVFRIALLSPVFYLFIPPFASAIEVITVDCRAEPLPNLTLTMVHIY